jgi:hypothetical protein
MSSAGTREDKIRLCKTINGGDAAGKITPAALAKVGYGFRLHETL